VAAKVVKSEAKKPKAAVSQKKVVSAPVKKVSEPAKKKPVVQPVPVKSPAVAVKEQVVAKTAAAAPAKSDKQAEVSKPEAKKEVVKTVEQQFSEQQNTAVAATKAGKSKEELFVPKYQLPTHVETVRPMRPKPPAIQEDAPQKPVANPIYVPPAPDGKPGIKFAPIAIVEKAKEKEKPNKSEDDDMSSKTSPRLAFNESDDKKGVSVEAKLRALYGIQLIDSRIDKIHAMRGELPLEVQDLEDDVAGLQERIKNLNDDVKNLNEEITGKKNGIKNSEALIKKYKEQLNNVKNNREYDSLNKEIEFQELEIQLHNKKIREFELALNAKKDVLAGAEVKLQERTNDLNLKRNELNDIIASTEKEEKILRKKSDEAKKLIEERLLSAYERIRSGAPNGMAVVPIEREASAGSFIQLPPQKQLDVAARKRVIVDEHSGRILVDSDLAREEQEKMDSILASELK
jgi:predicted  nucleic acid-binding Zn-ribbon protein